MAHICANTRQRPCALVCINSLAKACMQEDRQRRSQCGKLLTTAESRCRGYACSFPYSCWFKFFQNENLRTKITRKSPGIKISLK